MAAEVADGGASSLEALRGARSKLDAWVRSRDQLADRLHDLCTSSSSSDQLEELSSQLRRLDDEKCRKRTEIGDRHRHLETLKKMVLSANERVNYLETRLTVLRERRQAHNQVAADAMKGIEERLKQRQLKISAQTDAIKWYNRVLGLRAEFTSAIKFVFTKINPRNPEQEFSCTIRLDKDTHKYAMLDCVPYIKRSPDLLDDLNINNEFFEFMRLMRREFEKLVEESESKSAAVAEWCSELA